MIGIPAVPKVRQEWAEKADYLKRLALFTISEDQAKASTHFHLNGSTEAEIDCALEVDDLDVENAMKALDCYVTFQETIEKTGIRSQIGGRVLFEIFRESHNPPLNDLFERLP